MESQSEFSDASPVSEEALRAQLLQVRSQVEDCRRQAQLHEENMQVAMQSLSEGWQGGRVRDVMRAIDDIHMDVMFRFTMYARNLDDREDELQRDILRALTRAERSAQATPDSPPERGW